MADYRRIYKEHYGIEFGKEMAVHHIDFDRSNNDISNLILLPRALHQRYHLYLNGVIGNAAKPQIWFKYKLDTGGSPDCGQHELNVMKGYLETMEECMTWIRYKRDMDMAKATEDA